VNEFEVTVACAERLRKPPMKERTQQNAKLKPFARCENAGKAGMVAMVKNRPSNGAKVTIN